jgi:hypothetical protein
MTAMTDPCNHLKDGCKIYKMVHVLQSENIISVDMRKCRVSSPYKGNNKPVLCLSCNVSLHTTPCFGGYHMTKNYKTPTQKCNMIPDGFSNTALKNCDKLLLALM